MKRPPGQGPLRTATPGPAGQTIASWPSQSLDGSLGRSVPRRRPDIGRCGELSRPAHRMPHLTWLVRCGIRYLLRIVLGGDVVNRRSPVGETVPGPAAGLPDRRRIPWERAPGQWGPEGEHQLGRCSASLTPAIRHRYGGPRAASDGGEWHVNGTPTVASHDSVLPGGAKGTRTPDPLLAKIVNGGTLALSLQVRYPATCPQMTAIHR